MTSENPSPENDNPGRDAKLVGIGFMVLGMAAFSSMDAVSKVLAEEFSGVQVTWARYTFHILPMLLFAGPTRLASLVKTNNLWGQLQRGAALAISATAIIIAFKLMPLADAIAVSFVGPLLMVALSAWILREYVGLHRWLAVALGFVGVLIMAWPSAGVFELGALSAIVAALFWAIGLMMTRNVASDGPWVTLFYTGAVGAVMLSLITPFFWQMPDLRAWGLMVLMGVMGGIAHTLVINAFLRAQASALAPFNYLLLIWAVFFGWLLFDDLPGMRVIIGASIVVLAGLYAWYREQK